MSNDQSNQQIPISLSDIEVEVPANHNVHFIEKEKKKLYFTKVKDNYNTEPNFVFPVEKQGYRSW